MKYFWSIITILAFATTSCHQNERQDKSDSFEIYPFRPQIADTLKKLENYWDLPGHAVGYLARPSNHLETTRWFLKNMNNQDAHELLGHPNTFIKALAIKRLFRDKDPQLFDLIVDAYSDTLQVQQESGCTGYTYTIFEYCLETIHYPYPFLKDTMRWTENQTRLIDSLAMTTKQNNHYTEMKEAYKEFNKDKNATQQKL